MKKVILFEPWRIGDLVISLHVARYLHNHGIGVDLICSQRWVDWAATLGAISNVYGFDPPWTRETGKYDPRKYITPQFELVRKHVKSMDHDIVVDVRGDIRHYLFLKLYLQENVYSPLRYKNAYAYERPKIILERLGYDGFKYLDARRLQSPRKIVCFFDASDVNRSVPAGKRYKILETLLADNYQVAVISPSDRPPGYIKNLLSNQNLTIIQGRIPEIAAQVKNWDTCLSTDSGWLHVSHYLGLRTIALMGFDTRETWLPPGSTAVLSEEFYPGNLRYKRRYKNVQPLSTLSVEKIVSHLQEELPLEKVST